jgi:hypothetical protein
MKTTPPSNMSRVSDCTPSKLSLPTPMTAAIGNKQAPEPTQQLELIIDDLWQQVDDMHQSDTESEDSDDDHYQDVSKRRKPVMVRLPCGDIHICGGCMPCPFLISNEDRVFVCQYSGVQYEPEQTDEFFDLNGGTGKRSGDPDHCCGDAIVGKWNRRIDPIAASKMAYRNADIMKDNDMTEYMWHNKTNTIPLKKCIKRGALCVGEESEGQTFKRGRTSKKNTNDHDICINLQSEAESVLSKMINHKKNISLNHRRNATRTERNRPPPDPRMCDEKFVFNTSVKKYVRMCITNNTPPSIDSIHNLALMAQNISSKARDEAAEDDDDSVRTAKFRTTCTRFVVALWSAMCTTPYMLNAKRGTDAYRPFVCGVLYAFKRGIKLADGTSLLPPCPQLAAALPVLRGTGHNTVAKTLHSSSHRGLCTISRCIASVPVKDQKATFEVVVRAAKIFANQTFSKRDI